MMSIFVSVVFFFGFLIWLYTFLRLRRMTQEAYYYRSELLLLGEMAKLSGVTREGDYPNEPEYELPTEIAT